MSKVSQKLPTVSVIQMYNMYIKELLKNNPDYTGKNYQYISNGQIIDELTGKVVINYTQFKAIIAAFNKKAALKIIKGFTLDLGPNLGNMFMARVERPAKSSAINMKESLALRKRLLAEGKLTSTNWKVPYTDDEFIMLQWHKGHHRLPNINFYKFKTAGGQPGKGFRYQISSANLQNPHLKALYPFIPCKTLEPIQ